MNKHIVALNTEMLKEKGVKAESVEWSETAYKLNEIRTAISNLKLQEKWYKEKLINISGDTSSYNDEFFFEKIEAVGRLDYVAILKDYNVDKESYRKEPVISWKLKKL